MNDKGQAFAARCFGLTWQSDVRLDQYDPLEHLVGEPEINVRRLAALPERTVRRPINHGLLFEDGFRFAWKNVATFDCVGGHTIGYLPGTDWQGEMPPAFYGTVCSMALAWQGFVPLHATAVELDGRAFLIAGMAGAGKSTLAAELLSAGGKLVSDDLTMVTWPEGNQEQPHILRGRVTMRLHPQSAERVATRRVEDVPDDPRGKLLVWPQQRSEQESLPLAGLIMLTGKAGPLSPLELATAVPKLLFRPSWLSAIGGQQRRMRQLLEGVTHVPACHFHPLSAFGDADRATRLAEALAAIAMLRKVNTI